MTTERDSQVESTNEAARDEDSIDRRLADFDLDADSASGSADPTLRVLRSNLDTLAETLRTPRPLDDFAHEPACREATARAADLTQLTSLPPAAVEELQTLGQYRCIELLGQGGMGAVYKAVHTRLDKVVALKILRSDYFHDQYAVARFEREMKAAGRVEHPHVVRATDAGHVDGIHYLAMEYVRGVDLARLSNELGPLPIAEACELMRQAALGLQAAHQHGLVHRDVKPGNLILAESDHGPRLVKVLDLGLAQLADLVAPGNELTTAGQVMGTFDYMAPEQAGDTHNVDARADVYSLGATLYKLITGRIIYHDLAGATPLQKLNALANRPAPAVRSLRPDTPTALETLINTKLIAKDPRQRLATAADVSAALAPFAANADLAALHTRQRRKPPHLEAQDTQTVLQMVAAPTPAEGSTVASKFPRERIVERPARRASRALLWGLAALALLLVVAAGVVFTLKTPQGTVVVELADDLDEETRQRIQIEASGDGQLKVADEQSGWAIAVREGKYQLKVSGDAADRVTLSEDEVRVERNQKKRVSISLKPVAPAVVANALPASRGNWIAGPEQQAFFDHVAALSPEEQVAAVQKKLQEVNPGYTGELGQVTENQRVAEVSIDAGDVAELWPVAAFADLKHLTLRPAKEPLRSKLTDLSPLTRLRLLTLSINHTNVSDLAPLAGMSLAKLSCQGTPVADLAPLAGLRLVELNIGRTKVVDLSPLAGMPLTKLHMGYTPIGDLTPLTGMPLQELWVNDTLVTDLSPIAAAPLKWLTCDLAPISDFEPLREMPLRTLSCSIGLYDDEAKAIVRSLKQLVQLHARAGGQMYSPDEFWRRHQAQRQAADDFAAQIATLSPDEQAQAIREKLHATERRNKFEFSARDGRIEEVKAILYLERDACWLRGLTSLKRLSLDYGATNNDLTPLTGLPLESLTCSRQNVLRNGRVWQHMPSLKIINGRTYGNASRARAAGPAPTASPPK